MKETEEDLGKYKDILIHRLQEIILLKYTTIYRFNEISMKI